MLFVFDCSMFGHFLFSELNRLLVVCEEITGPCLQLPQDPRAPLKEKPRKHFKTQTQTRKQSQMQICQAKS